MAAQNVCRYFKFGFCKFLERCRFMHVNEECVNKQGRGHTAMGTRTDVDVGGAPEVINRGKVHIFSQSLPSGCSRRLSKSNVLLY